LVEDEHFARRRQNVELDRVEIAEIKGWNRALNVMIVRSLTPSPLNGMLVRLVIWRFMTRVESALAVVAKANAPPTAANSKRLLLLFMVLLPDFRCSQFLHFQNWTLCRLCRIAKLMS
jgi:hypothetical protein